MRMLPICVWQALGHGGKTARCSVAPHSERNRSSSCNPRTSRPFDPVTADMHLQQPMFRRLAVSYVREACPHSTPHPRTRLTPTPTSHFAPILLPRLPLSARGACQPDAWCAPATAAKTSPRRGLTFRVALLASSSSAALRAARADWRCVQRAARSDAAWREPVRGSTGRPQRSDWRSYRSVLCRSAVRSLLSPRVAHSDCFRILDCAPEMRLYIRRSNYLKLTALNVYHVAFVEL